MASSLTLVNIPPAVLTGGGGSGGSFLAATLPFPLLPLPYRCSPLGGATLAPGGVNPVGANAQSLDASGMLAGEPALLPLEGPGILPLPACLAGSEELVPVLLCRRGLALPLDNYKGRET